MNQNLIPATKNNLNKIKSEDQNSSINQSEILGNESQHYYFSYLYEDQKYERTRGCRFNYKIYQPKIVPRDNRKGLKYAQISNDDRLALIEKVTSGQISIKAAATEYKINFSTAKGIIQTYRKEGRVGKKQKRFRRRASCIIKQKSKSKKVQTFSQKKKNSDLSLKQEKIEQSLQPAHEEKKTDVDVDADNNLNQKQNVLFQEAQQQIPKIEELEKKDDVIVKCLYIIKIKIENPENEAIQTQIKVQNGLFTNINQQTNFLYNFPSFIQAPYINPIYQYPPQYNPMMMFYFNQNYQPR